MGNTKKIIKLGLKIWSPDTDSIEEAFKLYREKMYDYVELYVVPGSFDTTIDYWKRLHIPYIIHCAHSFHGFNLAHNVNRQKNKEIFEEVKNFADVLSAAIIIVHGGNDGPIEETIFQLNGLQDIRLAIENKPYWALNSKKCIGYSPEEILRIKKTVNPLKFVLDFGHAIYASNSLRVNASTFIESFLKLSPDVFHLGDGDIRAEKDCHKNFNRGTFDIGELMSFVPDGSYLTIETPREEENGLNDFVADMAFLWRMLSQRKTVKIQ